MPKREERRQAVFMCIYLVSRTDFSLPRRYDTDSCGLEIATIFGIQSSEAR